MTHCERVLALLADGQPHSHHEGYALNVILHSRVSELRKRGHRIDMWRDGDLYMYQLAGSPLSRSDPLPPPRAHRDAGDTISPFPGAGSDRLSDGQLALTEAAA